MQPMTLSTHVSQQLEPEFSIEYLLAIFATIVVGITDYLSEREYTFEFGSQIYLLPQFSLLPVRPLGIYQFLVKILTSIIFFAVNLLAMWAGYSEQFSVVYEKYKEFSSLTAVSTSLKIFGLIMSLSIINGAFFKLLTKDAYPKEKQHTSPHGLNHARNCPNRTRTSSGPLSRNIVPVSNRNIAIPLIPVNTPAPIIDSVAPQSPVHVTAANPNSTHIGNEFMSERASSYEDPWANDISHYSTTHRQPTANTYGYLNAEPSSDFYAPENLHQHLQAYLRPNLYPDANLYQPFNAPSNANLHPALMRSERGSFIYGGGFPGEDEYLDGYESPSDPDYYYRPEDELPSDEYLFEDEDPQVYDDFGELVEVPDPPPQYTSSITHLELVLERAPLPDTPPDYGAPPNRSTRSINGMHVYPGESRFQNPDEPALSELVASAHSSLAENPGRICTMCHGTGLRLETTNSSTRRRRNNRGRNRNRGRNSNNRRNARNVSIEA